MNVTQEIAAIANCDNQTAIAIRLEMSGLGINFSELSQRAFTKIVKEIAATMVSAA